MNIFFVLRPPPSPISFLMVRPLLYAFSTFSTSARKRRLKMIELLTVKKNKQANKKFQRISWQWRNTRFTKPIRLVCEVGRKTYFLSRRANVHLLVKFNAWTRQRLYRVFWNLDCSKSPIFAWDRRDIARLTINGSFSDFHFSYGESEGAGVGKASSGIIAP